MKQTKPVFIVGSGRCGTYALSQLLQGQPNIEIHHEYLFENILKPAVMYAMGVMDDEAIIKVLRETHEPAVHYTKAKYWVDCSNALPWVIQPLYKIFPEAQFVHIVRDGRKVTSSFYNKFQEVMYNDDCTAALTNWLDSDGKLPCPPPEKKFWRPVPRKDDKLYRDFQDFDRFQRLCYYWSLVNEKAMIALEKIPAQQKKFYRFEELIENKAQLTEFLALMGVSYDEKFYNTLKRPTNVHIPENFHLSVAQNKQFKAIAWDMMKKLGYDSREAYDVKY